MEYHFPQFIRLTPEAGIDSQRVYQVLAADPSMYGHYLIKAFDGGLFSIPAQWIKGESPEASPYPPG